MENLINEIVDILKDYRRENLNFFYRTDINSAHVKKWVEQFEIEDREFILSEFLHLLPKSYFSKDLTIQLLENVFNQISKHLKYENTKTFLEHVIFLDCQPNHKSQNTFLEIVNKILKDKYDLGLQDCGSKEIKYWIYLDDILATGGTFREDIKKEINNYGISKFYSSNIKIMGIFLAKHHWASRNLKHVLSLHYKDTMLGSVIKERIWCIGAIDIENDPTIAKCSTFNHIYPIKNYIGEEVLKFVEKNISEYAVHNEGYAFRDPECISNTFFSSEQNRIRYEHILLYTGFEIIKKVENNFAKSLRPLGMTPPTYKTLGTGSHIFTWRNISNTCPIVFWWSSNDWYPLFPVKNRGLI